MRGVFEPIKIEINGKSYDAEGEVAFVTFNPTVIHHRIIVINNDESLHPELASFIRDSFYDVKDLSFPCTYDGRYRYVGSNYKHHIFDDTVIA